MSQTLEDENQGQSSGMEWGVRSPRNANTSLAAAWERVEWMGEWKGRNAYVNLKEQRGLIALTGLTVCAGSGGEQGPQLC